MVNTASAECCAIKLTRSTRSRLSECFQGPRVGLRVHVVPGEQLATEFDHGCISFRQPVHRLAATDAVDDRRFHAFLQRGDLVDTPLVLRVVFPGGHEARQCHHSPPHAGFQRRQTSTVTADVPGPGALGRKLAAVEIQACRLALAPDQGKAASGIRVNVVGRSKRQREELFPARRQVLIERGQSCGGAGIPGHQVDEIDQIARPEKLQRARVGVRAQSVPAKDLTAHLDDRRFLRRNSGDPVPVADDVDDGRIQSDGDGFHLMKRPLVRLVMLAGGRQDGQFGELTPDGGSPPHVHS